MRIRASKCVIMACALVIGSATPAAGQVLWSWSFGSEQGTFVTDGSFPDTASPGNFTITNFEVTASAYPLHVGAAWYETQPPQGFLWDGSAPTQFWRSGGTYTNGSNFFITANDWYYTFAPGTSYLNDWDEFEVLSGTLTLVPLAESQSGSGIPTLSFRMVALFSLLTALAGFWLLRR